MGGIGRGAHLCFILAMVIGIILLFLLWRESPVWYRLGLAVAEVALLAFGLWLEWRRGSPKSIAEFCKENPWGDPPPPPD